MVLERRTSQNIVRGGAAGCMPVLIGWSAVTGSLARGAVLLFGVVFCWTPAHYWPLAMRYRDDHASAGVPMLPVVAGDVRGSSAMLAHAVAMVACAGAVAGRPVTGLRGGVRAAGGWFLRGRVGLVRRAAGPARPEPGAMRVLTQSITYLALIFVAVALDVLLAG